MQNSILYLLATTYVLLNLITCFC